MGSLLLCWVNWETLICCLLGESHSLCGARLLGFSLVILISHLGELLNASQFLHLGPNGRTTSEAILTFLHFCFICFKYLREPCDYCLCISKPLVTKEIVDTVPILQVSSEFTQEIEDCAIAESLLRYLTKLQTH